MSAPPTRTDYLLQRVQRAIERRRPTIDGATGIRRIELVIKFHEQTGRPQYVEWRMAEVDDDAAPLRSCPKVC